MGHGLSRSPCHQSTKDDLRRAHLSWKCNLSPWEVKKGGSRVQGHTGLYNHFKASLACVRPCFKTLPPPKKKKTNNKQNKLRSPSQEESAWDPLSLSCMCLLLGWLLFRLTQGEIPSSCPLPGSLVGRVPSEESSQAWHMLPLPEDRATGWMGPVLTHWN